MTNSDEQQDALIDELLKNYTGDPKQILGESGLLKRLEKRFLERAGRRDARASGLCATRAQRPRQHATFRFFEHVGSRNALITGLNHTAYSLAHLGFAAPVTRTPRKTRFRLLARLYRMGLDAHWMTYTISR